MSIDDHRGLLAWQKSVDLVLEIYAVTAQFPSYQQYELGRQMRRAAVSIPSNIAEGNARRHRREYLQYLNVARASASELSTHVEIAKRLDFLRGEEASALHERLDHISRMLHRLIGRLT